MQHVARVVTWRPCGTSGDHAAIEITLQVATVVVTQLDQVSLARQRPVDTDTPVRIHRLPGKGLLEERRRARTRVAFKTDRRLHEADAHRAVVVAEDGLALQAKECVEPD